MSNNAQNTEYEVTDPVTHLPIRVHDATDIELERIPPPPSLTEDRKRRKEDGRLPQAPEKTIPDLMDEMTRNPQLWWDDPLGDQSRTRIQTALIAAAVATMGAFVGQFGFGFLATITGQRSTVFPGFWDVFFTVIGSALLGIVVAICALSFHMFQEKKPRREANLGRVPNDPFQNPHTFKGDRNVTHLANKDPESAIWLNSFLKSLWPLLNPSLFTAVCDIVEDSLQASMPAFIQGVKVADINQGSEPLRILSIRCLDKGSAGVSSNGLEAEEGEFVNMEVALGYRAKDTSGLRGLRTRSANLHILTQFWFAAGGFKLPVWVELEGMLAVARVRIQLMSTPPFLSVATVTLLGQPKLKMKATPLKKGFLNVMDLPYMSGWLQRTINASIRDMVVAPRSMTVDLKETLMGQMEKDTQAIGVIVVTVRKAVLKGSDGNSGTKRDAYVTVGWSKLGKAMWSTRIITDAVVPVWEETTFLLVGLDELNIQEGLKLELWDSDRFTADDLVGVVDVPLRKIIHSSSTHNHIARREDRLMTKGSEPTAGVSTMIWECGYYEKTTLSEHRSEVDVKRIRADVDKKAQDKLREAINIVDIEREQQEETEDEEILAAEIEQQKEEDFKEKSDELITGEAPLQEYASGILSIHIEQIVGLEVQKIRESGVPGEEEREGGKDDEDEDDLPSSYCTVIINERKVYRTRTKMKDDNPYFAATTEKFVRDWRNTTMIISVRDYRFHEVDPLLGVVVLPMQEIFKKRNMSIFQQTMPIMGGIGYGKMKLTLIFRSVKLALPKRLRGWDVGTVEVFSSAKMQLKAGQEGSRMLEGCKMAFRIGTGAGAGTGEAKGKMVPHHPEESYRDSYAAYLGYDHKGDAEWISKRGKPVCLPVKNRYASSLVVEFRRRVTGSDHTVSFGTVWLKDIPDDEEVKVTVPIFSYRMRKDSIGKKEKMGVKFASMNATAPTDTRVLGKIVEGKNDVHDDPEHDMGYLEGDRGESIGHVELRLRIHAGLSGYHGRIADKDQAMADVMEVLDCLQGTHGMGKQVIRGIDHPGGEDRRSVSTTSSTSTSEDSGDEYERHSVLQKGGEKEKGGVVGGFKKFKKHQGDLHRKHRGLLQWKAARNAIWLGRGVEDKGGKLAGRIVRPFVGHRERQIAMDWEV